MTLSRASPTEQKDGMSPALRTFSVNAHDVKWLDSMIGMHDASLVSGEFSDCHVKGLDDQQGVLDRVY